jgi:hypothetical protein
LLPVGRPKIHAMQFLIYLHVLSSIFPQTGLPVWGSYSLERVACLGRMILTVSPGLRPQSVGSGWSHDFLHLSFICLPLVSHSGSGWWHDFPSLSPVCLSFVSHLSPTLGLVGRMISLTCFPFVFHLSPALGPGGRMISLTCLPFVFHVSPTLGRVGRMFSLSCLPFVFDLSFICLPLWVPLVA